MGEQIALFLGPGDEGYEAATVKLAKQFGVTTQELKANSKEIEKILPLFKRPHMTMRDKILEEFNNKPAALNKNDFYFDDVLGAFFLKKIKFRDQYYYDPRNQIWRTKRKSLLLANDYYFDIRRGFFLHKNRLLPRNTYTYNAEMSCYHLASQDPQDKNRRGWTPLNFCFNENIGKWELLSKENALKVVVDEYSGRQVIEKDDWYTPDDYYFDLHEREFKKKMMSGASYFYDQGFCAWKQKDQKDVLPPRTKLKRLKTPLSFYWDDKGLQFLKKDAPSTFFDFDANNGIMRKKRFIRGRFNPKSWRWNDAKKCWEFHTRSRSWFFSQALKWRPDRDYDKPWLEFFGDSEDFDKGKYEQQLEDWANMEEQELNDVMDLMALDAKKGKHATTTMSSQGGDLETTLANVDKAEKAKKRKERAKWIEDLKKENDTQDLPQDPYDRRM